MVGIIAVGMVGIIAVGMVGIIAVSMVGIKAVGMVGIIADEAADASNKQQLGLVLRYTIKHNVAERLYDNADFESITV